MKETMELKSDEHVIQTAKLHWVVFAYSALWVFVSVYLFINVPEWRLFAYITLLFAAVTWLAALLNFTSSVFTVTNQRVLIKQGFVQSQNTQILLQRVTSVDVNKNLIGRTLDYGAVRLHGVGGSVNELSPIASPDGFAAALQAQLDAMHDPRNRS